MSINLITVTGHPGSGKTEVLDEIKADFGKNGISFAEINEYTKHIHPWAKENRESDLVDWREDGGGENFVLNPAAYEVMCPAVAVSIADEIAEKYRESKPVVVLLEAARNVGMPQVGYIDGLWQPLKDALMVEGLQVNMVNVEVEGGHRDVLWARLEKRLEEDPKAAPPECLNNYHFDEFSGMPILASNELKDVSKELVELSLKIENGRGWEDLEREIGKVTRRIRQEDWWPRYNAEGVLRTKESLV